MDDMDLIDLFAIVAMHGRLSNGDVPKNMPYEVFADECYDLAEAMISSRMNKEDMPYEEWMGS